MRNTILAALAAVALVLGFGAASATAASNGTHTQTYSCSSGGTTTSVAITYIVSGIGTSSLNSASITGVSIDTNPNAALNRVSVYGLNDYFSSGGDVLMVSFGGSASTLNDVTDGYRGGGSLSPNAGYSWGNGVTEYVKVNVSGGVGDSTATCGVQKRLL